MNFNKILIVLFASFSCFTLHCQLRNSKSSSTPTSGLSQFPNLLKACKENDTQKVESLISTCELFHSKNPEWSPLVWAVAHQNVRLVKILLDKDCYTNIKGINFKSFQMNPDEGKNSNILQDWHKTCSVLGMAWLYFMIRIAPGTYKKSIEIVKLLLKKDASLTKQEKKYFEDHWHLKKLSKPVNEYLHEYMEWTIIADTPRITANER